MRRLRSPILAIFSLLLASNVSEAAPAFSGDAARGHYLAVLGDCAGCHTRSGGAPFTGGQPFKSGFGTVYSTNITSDPQTGIGGWTQAQFYRALHDGIAADGTHLYPAFPYIYFRRLSRQDTDDLFAYLHTLQPVHRNPSPNRLAFPFNIRAMMVFWNWLFRPADGYKPDGTSNKPHSASWKRGEFLVNGPGHCAACHTPKNMLFGDVSGQALTGATVSHWFAANLTSAQQGGLGKWSLEDVRTYLRTGRNRYATAAGTMQEKVSSSTSHMTNNDQLAIATYLKSLSANGLSGDAAKPDAQQMKAGDAVFVQHCEVCHQPPQKVDALNKDAPLPDYPQLGGDTLVLGRDPTTVLRVILEGAEAPDTPGKASGYSMPSFATLSDQQVADVATYIRASWGNQASPVTADTVTTLRDAIQR